MKNTVLRALICTLAVLLAMSPAVLAILPASAAEDTVYLGDRQDLFIARDSLDDFGWNTAHSGEPITIGTQKYDKGIGFHCLPDRDAYVEFDISSLGMKYFSAFVGVLQEANYFIEWGSISFHVYGDGKLLASSPMVEWNNEPYFLSCAIEGVSTLKLVQKNENGHACDAGVWGNACLTIEQPKAPDAGEEGEPTMNPDKTTLTQPEELVSGDYAYVSDLYWMDNNTYPGNVVGRDCNTANEIIFSNDGKFFEKGVGFHASSGDYTSFVDVNIEGLGFTKFAAYYGVCETLTAHDITMASVKFAVFGDGVKLWESDAMKFGQDMASMDCDISGVSVLRLAVAGAPGIGGAWGTWGGAVISKSGNITDDMIYLDPADVTEPPLETDASTDSETDSVTEPPTIPETEAKTTEPEATVSETNTESETQSQKKGCGAAIGTASVGIALTACTAAVLKKKKED
ncbi:MAG: NPCBM/NEW2 domain-containing protein [Clostridia bacterium]|nr:NPCBM/NEW2 domain-containing protein [Clostridia bacterium]